MHRDAPVAAPSDEGISGTSRLGSSRGFLVPSVPVPVMDTREYARYNHLHRLGQPTATGSSMDGRSEASQSQSQPQGGDVAEMRLGDLDGGAETRVGEGAIEQRSTALLPPLRGEGDAAFEGILDGLMIPPFRAFEDSDAMQKIDETEKTLRLNTSHQGAI